METCTRIGIKRKEKKEGRGRGQESSPSPPRSCPLSHHTDDAQQHHSASQQPAAAHTMAPRARAQGPKFRMHTASTKGGAGAMAGRLTDKIYRQTETARRNATQRREGLGKEGRDLKNHKEQGSGDGGAHSVSLVLTDESQSLAPSV